MGTQSKLEDMSVRGKKLEFKRWTDSDIHVVKYSKMNAFEEKLLMRYKLPEKNAASQLIDQAFLNETLNERNYFNRMHKLLYIEEIEQLKL